MKKTFKIPTIFGIIAIIISLSLTVFLFKNITNFLSKATPEIIPKEVKITNITANSFSVSWITDSVVSGSVSFGENENLTNLANDDRDQVSGSQGNYSTHHVSLRYLKNNTKYFFKILSSSSTFDNNGQPYMIKTLTEASSVATQPVYGTIINPQGSSVSDIVVYLELGSASPQSTLVKPSGSWLINPLASSLQDKIEIFIQAGKEGTTVVTTNLQNSNPVPQITLGKNSDFRNQPLTTNPDQTTNPTQNNNSGFKAPPPPEIIPSLIKPATESAIPSDQPNFSGTGVPGTTVKIEVNSETITQATTTVDTNGNWNWTPPAGLPPGDHTVTVTMNDKNGNLLNFMRHFTVLAAGTQVNQSATPAANLTTPTASPTATPKPIMTATPAASATPSSAPASGNLTPTFFLILFGLIFFSLGLGKFIVIDKL